MSLLYEQVFGRSRQFSLVKDTERTLTVTLAAGKGTVISAEAKDKDLKTTSKAYPGQQIFLYVDVQNTGDSDAIWADVKDKDTGQIIVRTDGVKAQTPPAGLVNIINAGAHLGWSVGWFTMPNRTWNLLVEAGHGQA